MKKKNGLMQKIILSTIGHEKTSLCATICLWMFSMAPISSPLVGWTKIIRSLPSSISLAIMAFCCVAQRDAGKAVLLISLELDEVMNLADTIGVIYNGEIQKIADAREKSITSPTLCRSTGM